MAAAELLGRYAIGIDQAREDDVSEMLRRAVDLIKRFVKDRIDWLKSLRSKDESS